MKKALWVVVLGLAMSIAAVACTGIFTTNVPGIRWQYCPENTAVAVGNFGPRVVTIDFNVIYIDGTYDSYEETIVPRAFVTEVAGGPVARVVVTNGHVY